APRARGGRPPARGRGGPRRPPAPGGRRGVPPPCECGGGPAPPSGQVAADPRTSWAALSGTAMRTSRPALLAVWAGRRGPPHLVGGAEWHRHANVAACPARCLGRSPRTPHLVGSVAPPCESC